MNLIIIGTGLAGYTLAKEIRKLNQAINITMITDNDGAFYSKPNLSTALTKNKSSNDLIQNTAKEMEEKYKIKILTHTKVNSIDTEKSQINIEKKSFQYDSLVLAVGANPFRPPINGNASNDALSINSLNDYKVFRKKLQSAEKVAIIGPGLIGCEFANDLISQDKEVYVIGPDAYPMSGLLTKETGEYLQDELSKYKVNWHLNCLPKSINKLNDKYEILLNNNQSIFCDLIISAVGLRANLSLIKNTNINHDKAILVNEYLQTNISNIYAVGDCAQVNSHYLPFVAPILSGTKALAKTLNKDKTNVQYKASSIIVKTSNCPLVIAKPNTKHDTSTLTKTKNGLKLLYLNNEKKIIGFILMGDQVKEKQILTKFLPDFII
ncbi:MAG: FAD-dependent oxidoreductase [Candidatus Cloacimonadota bacterium]|nr:MAG: FAD-dependent oxidoreductase [Candidatus Cloacimonadota bacterium]